MADSRTPRELQTREKSTRKRAWQRPEVLPMPLPQDGYEFRWVRVSTLGSADAPNVSSSFREGWEPCKAADHPEIELVTVETDRYKDNIVIGGLMLCKAPVEMLEERSEFYQTQADQQMRSVDNNFMRENDHRMPLFKDRKTTVTFGKGT
jgi:hypothetical protein